MIGTSLAHYRVLRRLGAGGMGEVYLALDTRLQREVALKVLPETLADSARLARFEREARAVAALNHPNIVTLHAIEEADGRPFLVLELVEGETLRQRIPSTGFELEELLRLAVPLVDAVAAAHARGVTHRDLKPDNVMVTWDGHLKVLDFGLAKLRLPEADSTADTLTRDAAATGDGMVMGTPGHMAPEQIRGQRTDARTDVFALGLLLFEAATGRHPFPADGPMARSLAILGEKPLALSRLRPDLPRELERLLDRCLEKDPDRRLASAAELRHDLEALKGRLRQAPGRTPTVAVLPFADMSAEHDQAYFCEGLAEELINALTRVDGLQVISRTSAFRFQKSDLDIRDIGRQLNADSVLEGSVRKAGSRVRVTAQLIDVANGYHLWSERFDRQLDDVFAIQEEIAERSVESLRGVLREDEREVLRGAGTSSPQAWDFYLQGRQLFWQQRFVPARALYHRAVELEPGFARAWSQIAILHAWTGAWFGRHEEQEAAEAAARRALELAPDLPEAHVAAGTVHSHAGRGPEAERHLARARELDPHLWDAWYFSGRAAWAQGKLEAALLFFERAAEVDPEDYQALSLASQLHANRGDREAMVRACRVCLERVKRHLEHHPEDARATIYAAFSAWRLGDRERALAWAERVHGIANEEPVHYYNLACFYTVLGDPDRALTSLEKFNAAGQGFRDWMEHDSDLDPLRSDPRFQALMARWPTG
ncbi:MAG: eukaryotic-like serine/threonine-protein kinase [Acidobacteriota bacterium]|jgi:non-specific serine/threonine protein kinase|nr:eukaryotic-like serine/threonine-protein kinase [Acidobacteriota bacterium]